MKSKYSSFLAPALFALLLAFTAGALSRDRQAADSPRTSGRQQPRDAGLAQRRQALTHLISEQKFEQAEAALESEPALLEEKDELSLTVLHTAVLGGPVKASVPFITWLLAHGANPNATASDGTTPLMLAVRSEELPPVIALLQGGSDPAMRDAHGFTALSIAASLDSDQIARELMKAGAEPDLFQAAELGLTDRLTALLHNDPHLLEARDEITHSTALLLAATHRRHEAVRLLLSFHPSLDVYSAAATGQIEFLQSHLSKDDPAVNARDPFTRQTPLLMAVQGGDLNTIRLLLDYGAEVNAGLKGPMAGSPLAAAIQCGDKEAARLLVERGADTKHFYPGFGNAYAMALARHRPDIAELVK